LGEAVADGVGGGEVAGRAGLFAKVEEEGEQGAEGGRVGQVVEGGEAEPGGQVEEGDEPLAQLAGRVGVAVLQPADQRVGLGDELEQHGQGGRDVEVVVQGDLEPLGPNGRRARTNRGRA
jgi:hypothetical protein